jgi:hypothetical protein
VQFGGDAEVVAPPPGVSSDSLLYYFFEPNQPTSYLSHSNLVATGTTVLSSDQLHQLGVALNAIHERFSPAYGPASGNQGWYAMDVEFKFDNDEAPDPSAERVMRQRCMRPERNSTSNSRAPSPSVSASCSATISFDGPIEPNASTCARAADAATELAAAANRSQRTFIATSRIGSLVR